MRCLERNKRLIHYCLYNGTEPILDDNGYDTGESKISYTKPVGLRANVSTATGMSSVEQFGNSLQYDKVLVVDDMACPIDEHTVLFVDKLPEFDTDGNPLFDYIVKRVAKSLNSISIALSKVEVS